MELKLYCTDSNTKPFCPAAIWTHGQNETSPCSIYMSLFTLSVYMQTDTLHTVTALQFWVRAELRLCDI